MKGRILMFVFGRYTHLLILTPFIAYSAYDTPAIIIHAIFFGKNKEFLKS